MLANAVMLVNKVIQGLLALKARKVRMESVAREALRVIKVLTVSKEKMAAKSSPERVLLIAILPLQKETGT